MSNLNKPLIPKSTDVNEVIEAELRRFDRFFRTLQEDGLGLLSAEKALLRDYILWATNGRPKTAAEILKNKR